MPGYRLFTLDHAGHFADVEEMFCVNDAEAMLRAGAAAKSHDVELWRRGRMLTRIMSQKPSAAVSAEEPETVAAAA